MGMFRKLGSGLGIVVLLLLSGCSGLPSSRDMPQVAELKPEPYEIGIGDTVSIHVWRNPELTQTIVVRPDGYVSMPLIGDVLADGKEPESLALEVRKGLEEFIRNPEVTVLVVDPTSKEYRNRVRITGQVAAPQSIAFQPGMTVLDLVLLSGGTTDFAADDRAVLHRQIDGQYQSYSLDLDDILTDGNMETNHRLQPGDVISVPRKQIFRGEL